MVPVPRPRARLAAHEVGHDLELPGVDVAVPVEIEHLEGDLKVTAGGAQYGQQENVVGERDQATCNRWR